jgi:hypothetical protein
MKRWQDWVNAVLGLGFIASPWILGFADTHGLAARWFRKANSLPLKALSSYKSLRYRPRVRHGYQIHTNRNIRRRNPAQCARQLML